MAPKKRPKSSPKSSGLPVLPAADRPAAPAWYRVTYRCAFGHDHKLMLPDPPETLDQMHGRYVGGVPQCRSQLKLVKKESI